MPSVSTVFGQRILSWLCAPGFHLNVRFCQSGAMSVPDYYSVLGVERDARPAQIKKARLGYSCQIAALDDLSSQRQWQHLILNKTTWKQRDEIPQFEKDSKFCIKPWSSIISIHGNTVLCVTSSLLPAVVEGLLPVGQKVGVSAIPKLFGECPLLSCETCCFRSHIWICLISLLNSNSDISVIIRIKPTPEDPNHQKKV